jgi:transposase
LTDTSIAVQTFNAIEEQFDLHPRERIKDLDESDLLAKLHQYLAERILEIMNRNFEELMQTLYRIDVSEVGVKRIFKDTDEHAIAGKLATLIIDRQRQKAETRAAFRSGNESE